MNEHEIARIAAMGNALRPDWPVASLKTMLSKPELANKGRRDVAVALAWVACDSETQKPARVIESGPWWHAANVEAPDRTHRRPPRPEEECRTHAGEYAGICRCCAADRKAARDAQTEQADTIRHRSIQEALAAARAAIRATTEETA